MDVAEPLHEPKTPIFPAWLTAGIASAHAPTSKDNAKAQVFVFIGFPPKVAPNPGRADHILTIHLRVIKDNCDPDHFSDAFGLNVTFFAQTLRWQSLVVKQKAGLRRLFADAISKAQVS